MFISGNPAGYTYFIRKFWLFLHPTAEGQKDVGVSVRLFVETFQPWLRGSGASLSCTVAFALTACPSRRAFIVLRFTASPVITMQGSSSGVVDALLKHLWRKHMLNKHRAEHL